MKKCLKCGSLQDDNNKFCGNCGAPDFTTDLAQSPVITAPPAPAKRSRSKLVPFLLGAVAALIVALIVVVCLLPNSVERVIDQIRNDEFSSAAELYQEDIMSDPEKLQQVHDEIVAYVDELMQQFMDHKISYEALTEKFDGIDKTGVLDGELFPYYDDAGYVQYIRNRYAEGETEFNNGNYQAAMECYNDVSNAGMEYSEEASEKYRQALELFRDDAIKDAQAKTEAGDFMGALNVISEALEILPEDEKLWAAHQACLDAQYEDNIQTLLEEARLYIEYKDFVTALDLLDDYIEVYPDEARFQQERITCLTQYEAYVIEESLKLAMEDNFQHALSLAEAGLEHFTSVKVTELVMVYKSHIPVLLTEMEVFKNQTQGGSWASDTDETDKYLEDIYGNKYTSSLSVGVGAMTYLVDFKYKEFSGTVGFPKGLASDGYRKSATLKIYGDGVLITEFVDVNEDFHSESFSLDISSYEKITLKWTCSGVNIWSDWGEFATIFDGVLVPIPLEIPTAS